MKKSKKKKNKKRIANNYLGMAAIAIVVLLLLGGLTYQSQTLKARIAVYDAKASALEDSIAGEQERTQEIDEQKEYMQTDEYLSLIHIYYEDGRHPKQVMFTSSLEEDLKRRAVSYTHLDVYKRQVY